MQKVVIIGCPGSGKSTFARKLHDITKIPLFHLDMLYWNADKTTVPKAVFRERLQEVIVQDGWIIDGNYGSTMEMRLQHCDTVFFLDYPTEVCLKGIMERKGKARTDMPWVESIEEEDEAFLSFVKEYNTLSRPKVISLLKACSDKEIFILRKREDADAFLQTLSKTDGFNLNE